MTWQLWVAAWCALLCAFGYKVAGQTYESPNALQYRLHIEAVWEVAGEDTPPSLWRELKFSLLWPGLVGVALGWVTLAPWPQGLGDRIGGAMSGLLATSVGSFFSLQREVGIDRRRYEFRRATERKNGWARLSFYDHRDRPEQPMK